MTGRKLGEPLVEPRIGRDLEFAFDGASEPPPDTALAAEDSADCRAATTEAVSHRLLSAELVNFVLEEDASLFTVHGYCIYLPSLLKST